MKKVFACYLDKELKRLAQVKAANELNVFKFSELVSILLKRYVEEKQVE